MKITVHNPELAPALTNLADGMNADQVRAYVAAKYPQALTSPVALTCLAVALQSDEAIAIDFGAFPMPCFEATYFAERSEHIVLVGDGVMSWNRHERIVSLATGAPSMDCVRLGFRGAQS